jgi:hypothetical protein
LYHTADLHRHLGVTKEASDQEERQTEKIIYTRVSSSRQKEDLQRQIQDLQTAFPEHSVISDTGSGLNFKRKGLSSLLDRVLQGLVKEAVARHNGQQSAANRRRRKRAAGQQQGDGRTQDSNVSNQRPRSKTQKMVGSGAMDLQPMRRVN